MAFHCLFPGATGLSGLGVGRGGYHCFGEGLGETGRRYGTGEVLEEFLLNFAECNVGGCELFDFLYERRDVEVTVTIGVLECSLVNRVNN